MSPHDNFIVEALHKAFYLGTRYQLNTTIPPRFNPEDEFYAQFLTLINGTLAKSNEVTND
jgi:hypothetical protein